MTSLRHGKEGISCMVPQNYYWHNNLPYITEKLLQYQAISAEVKKKNSLSDVLRKVLILKC